MTINGVKNILDNNENEETLNLDEITNNSIKATNLKKKLIKINKIIKNLKSYK